MKYRSRETVGAMQWFKPGDHEAVIEWVFKSGKRPAVGGKEICPGDWIITHADGAHSVCKAEDFEQEWESVKKLSVKAHEALLATAEAERMAGSAAVATALGLLLE